MLALYRADSAAPLDGPLAACPVLALRSWLPREQVAGDVRLGQVDELVAPSR